MNVLKSTPVALAAPTRSALSAGVTRRLIRADFLDRTATTETLLCPRGFINPDLHLGLTQLPQ